MAHNLIQSKWIIVIYRCIIADIYYLLLKRTNGEYKILYKLYCTS